MGCVSFGTHCVRQAGKDDNYTNFDLKITGRYRQSNRLKVTLKRLFDY
jgi:hypothetical protein